MNWHDEKERPIYAEIDRVTAQKVAAISEPNRDAVEAAAKVLRESYRQTGLTLDVVSAALTAAHPHLLAAKDAEIAALREALKECADDLEAEVEARYEKTKQHPSELRRYNRDIGPVVAARAALEMSGGVL